MKRASCDGSEPKEFLSGVSVERGTEILVSDMLGAQLAVVNNVEAHITPDQYGALVDFVFNVGAGNFKTSTLLKVVNSKQSNQLVADQFRRWKVSNGEVLQALITRREREVNLYTGGVVSKALPSAEEELAPIDIHAGEGSNSQ